MALLLAGAAPPFTTLYGFTVIGSAHERTAELSFMDVPSAAGALATTTAIASQPHEAGTPGDYQTALYMRDQLQSFGFAATLETLSARVDSPKKIGLVLYPTGRVPALASTVDAFHGIFSRYRTRPATSPPAPGASALPDALPPVAFDLREPPIESDADTANPAVGVPFLAGSGDGDLVAPLIYAGYGSDADYGRLTAHGVEVRGAIAIVRNAREFRGVTARRAQTRGLAGVIFYDDPAEDGAARGAAYPFGPYRPAASVRRGTVGEGVTIPALPVSAATAQALIGALRGPSAGPPWSGALAVRYPFARGPATARLTVLLARKQTTLWNTIGVLSGVQHPEQSIVMGAHRDAWVFGAGDDGSGIATLIEAARGLGYIVKGGWRPSRSIVVAGWDGEELGAYGTIAYVKRHGDELRTGGVAYLDAEQSVTGPRFAADAVAAVASTVVDATHVVADPLRPGATIYDRWALRSNAMPARSLGEGNLDRSASLFGIGTPSLNAGFGGVLGPYHSAYDTLKFATTYSDPDFVLHRSAAQIYGVIAMRLADADVVPYRFGTYVPLMRANVRALSGAARTAKVRVDASGLASSIGRFATAARRFDIATANVATGALAGRALEAARIVDIAVYGNDGYAAATLPDVARAVALGNQSEIDRAVARTRAAIDRASELLAF